MMALKHRRKFN